MTSVLAMAPPATLPPWIDRPPAAPEYRAAERIWVLSRHADVLAALRHPGVLTAEPEPELRHLVERAGLACPYLLTQFRGFLLSANPPWHTKARRFSRLVLRHMEAGLAGDAVDRIADQVVAELPRGIAFDAMPCCGWLPARVVAEGLGLAEATVQDLADRTTVVFAALRRRLPLRQIPVHEAMAEELSRRIGKAMSGTAVFDALRRAGAEECGMEEAEMNAVLAFFLLAATETTSTFLGSALHLLATHPVLPAMIRADPASLRPVFDELMRYCGPGRFLSLRRTAEPLELGGQAMPQGALLLLDVERAHFDPDAFADPGRIDPARRGPAHFGFGGGPHACLGMVLARQQATALLGRIVTACDIETQRGPLDWQEDFYLRRLRRLSITLHACR